MNKLYALILLFLAQSVCAMEGEQPKPRVFSFFNGGKPFEKLPDEPVIGCHTNQRFDMMTDEQKKDWYFNLRLNEWKNEDFPMHSCSQDWTPEAKNAMAGKKRRD